MQANEFDDLFARQLDRLPASDFSERDWREVENRLVINRLQRQLTALRWALPLVGLASVGLASGLYYQLRQTQQELLQLRQATTTAQATLAPPDTLRQRVVVIDTTYRHTFIEQPTPLPGAASLAPAPLVASARPQPTAAPQGRRMLFPNTYRTPSTSPTASETPLPAAIILPASSELSHIPATNAPASDPVRIDRVNPDRAGMTPTNRRADEVTATRHPLASGAESRILTETLPPLVLPGIATPGVSKPDIAPSSGAMTRAAARRIPQEYRVDLGLPSARNLTYRLNRNPMSYRAQASSPVLSARSLRRLNRLQHRADRLARRQKGSEISPAVLARSTPAPPDGNRLLPRDSASVARAGVVVRDTSSRQVRPGLSQNQAASTPKGEIRRAGEEEPFSFQTILKFTSVGLHVGLPTNLGYALKSKGGNLWGGQVAVRVSRRWVVFADVSGQQINPVAPSHPAIPAIPSPRPPEYKLRNFRVEALSVVNVGLGANFILLDRFRLKPYLGLGYNGQVPRQYRAEYRFMRGPSHGQGAPNQPFKRDFQVNEPFDSQLIHQVRVQAGLRYPVTQFLILHAEGFFNTQFRQTPTLSDLSGVRMGVSVEF
ncbi:MAG: hypothetical protein H7Y12_00765 [Sphingobacteriaceae bacterium]|nr:hypothetical protein [Cytophagaceae bacterium]